MLGFSGTREWVYPQSITGRFTTIRRWTFLGLHLVLFLAPWVRVGGHPLLRIDLPARRIFLLGGIFTSGDFFLLLLLLLFLTFALFFFTALWGRIWCGYACPQTVFLETWIRPLEQWIEGDRVTRRRRDRQGLTLDRAWRKALKWGAFVAVSFLLSMALVSFFSGARELWTGRAGPVSYALVGVLTFLWFWDFTWFREQFCSYLCPYARFQSALTDDETLLIAYDAARGEPRGGRDAAAEGRCVACFKCVVVCPQGIDIRDGFQMECIQCARCIDACESVMSRLGHRTLVEYSSMAGAEGRRVRRLRPRVAAYGGLLAALLVLGLGIVLERVPFEASVNRAPGSLYTVDGDGYLRNTFLLEITSKVAAAEPTEFRVTVEGIPGAEVLTRPVRLATAERAVVPLVIRLPQAAVERRTIPIEVRVESSRGESIRIPTTFKTGAHLGAGSPSE